MIFKSIIHQLEHCVLVMEQRGETAQQIHSAVEMILRGFIRDGDLTKEYLALAAQAQEFRAQIEREQARADTTSRADRPVIGEPII